MVVTSQCLQAGEVVEDAARQRGQLVVGQRPEHITSSPSAPRPSRQVPHSTQPHTHTEANTRTNQGCWHDLSRVHVVSDCPRLAHGHAASVQNVIATFAVSWTMGVQQVCEYVHLKVGTFLRCKPLCAPMFECESFLVCSEGETVCETGHPDSGTDRV